MRTMEAGNYKIKATGEYAFGTTGEGDTFKEQVAVVCACVGGDGAEQGRQFTWYGYFNSDANTKRTLEALKLLGWDGDAKHLIELPGLGSREAVGQFAENTYEGTTRLKLNFINDPDRQGAAVKNKLEGAQLMSFAQRMQGEIAKLGGGVSSPSKPAAPAAGSSAKGKVNF